MSLLVLKPGIMDTIQDAGRTGGAHLGIPVSGAADAAALAVGNALAGNHPDTAVIEMHWPAPVLLLESPAYIALSGADFGATAHGVPVKPNSSIYLSGGTELRFSRRVSGARAYLCVRGGFLTPEAAGSCSTHLLSGTGGLDGRQLLSGDKIYFDSGLQYAFPGLHASVGGLYPSSGIIRFTAGPEYDWLSQSSRVLLENSQWKTGFRSDRMGFELTGPEICTENRGEMVSSAVVPGTIQLPAGGKPFILLPDCQTTGGYPRIGQIISADLPAVARLSPGDQFRLVCVSREEALSNGYRHRLHLRRLQQGCLWQLKKQTNHEN